MTTSVSNQPQPTTAVPSRSEVEDLLYEEAALLDEWRLDEWLELFTDDARYIVPTTDLIDGDPKQVLGIIDDNRARLQGRVERLKSRRAHREFPYSRTRRLISNVRITGVDGDNINVEAAFLVYRLRSGEVDPLMGRYKYTLTRVDGKLRIRLRRAELDLEALRPHGTVSIIL